MLVGAKLMMPWTMTAAATNARVDMLLDGGEAAMVSELASLRVQCAAKSLHLGGSWNVKRSVGAVKLADHARTGRLQPTSTQLQSWGLNECNLSTQSQRLSQPVRRTCRREAKIKLQHKEWRFASRSLPPRP